MIWLIEVLFFPFEGDAREGPFRARERERNWVGPARVHGPLLPTDYPGCEGKPNSEQHHGLQECAQTGYVLHRDHRHVRTKRIHH